MAGPGEALLGLRRLEQPIVDPAKGAPIELRQL
jgi:hypothetical protein